MHSGERAGNVGGTLGMGMITSDFLSWGDPAIRRERIRVANASSLAYQQQLSGLWNQFQLGSQQQNLGLSYQQGLQQYVPTSTTSTLPATTHTTTTTTTTSALPNDPNYWQQLMKALGLK
jgi:hypothetical protein